MQQESSLLELKHIQKVFKNDIFKKHEVVLKDLSVNFPQGKCTGLLGHNGAGKTTTIRIIFGLIKQDLGEVLFNGTPITLKEKALFGYMPEISKLPATLTPTELLKYQLAIYNKSAKSKDLIPSMLKKVGLWEAKNKKIKNLSKGMGRRLAWAQATIHNPKLLILDEPLSGLDPIGRKDMFQWIKEYKTQDTTMILCTHQLWLIQDICDEINIINKGKLVYTTLSESKDTKNLFNRSFYQLHISGVNEEDLQKLKIHYNLSQWSKINQENFLCKLTFNDYSIASAWLKAALDSGLIVVKFSDELNIDNDELMEFFAGR